MFNMTFDIKKNPKLFLGKSKTELIEYLEQNAIKFEHFPQDQIDNGFNIINTSNMHFWFDCEDINYRIDVMSLGDLYFNKTKINKQGYALTVLDYLNNIATKLSETDHIDNDDMGKYKLVVYELEKLFRIYITYTCDNHCIFCFSLYVDGYNLYEYKRGISLEDYMQEYIQEYIKE
ncbi:hypothetical protein [Phocoenobacter skyensis]|uniref:Uncharacterized protein n=1 Tax=Phocoenobacter skyensis TaxID=97481 RepID=A0A1H7YDH0_9PAST|nr:hypothetical protein [Pasteurella skyensis]MDP8079717.1 hypothetical protein [Pasteurella skyensis]MDP8085708.1 hypothetical protein [Pasteurella skyensis]MDP8185477.1 hypothetical protein [Pasteurella skyensis]QLB22309.1 hypothetical protein A6B44_03475 [Pasteurella skyensis]SEM43914.1 hypothetical protein SAMN05444853_1186 [Pasteurella skyensis]